MKQLIEIDQSQYETLKVCYSQDRCRDGFMNTILPKDTFYKWKCGDICVGGRFITDVKCNCACKPMPKICLANK